MYRESIACGFYFYTYDKLNTNYNSFFSGGMAGCVAWTMTYPIDVLKTQQMTTNYSIKNCIKLNKNPRDISVGIILETIDGPFQPINYEPHSEVALGLQLCFDEMVKMVQKHLYEFSIQEIIDNDNPPNSLAFEI